MSYLGIVGLLETFIADYTEWNWLQSLSNVLVHTCLFFKKQPKFK